MSAFMWKVVCMMMFRGINRHPSLFLWVSTKVPQNCMCVCECVCVREREKERNTKTKKRKRVRKEKEKNKRQKEREKDGVTRIIFLLYLLSTCNGVAG